MKTFTKITYDMIADAFYDEDYAWLKDNLGIVVNNQSDAESKIEAWKRKNIKYQQSGGDFLIPQKVK